MEMSIAATQVPTKYVHLAGALQVSGTPDPPMDASAPRAPQQMGAAPNPGAANLSKPGHLIWLDAVNLAHPWRGHRSGRRRA